MSRDHRRRMEREAKAKVVASVWGADFVQFLAALAILPRLILKKRLNSSYSSKSTNRLHYIGVIVSLFTINFELFVCTALFPCDATQPPLACVCVSSVSAVVGLRLFLSSRLLLSYLRVSGYRLTPGYANVNSYQLFVLNCQEVIHLTS